MRWILGLVVLAALGAGAWLVLGGEHGGDAVLEDGEGRAEGGTREGALLSGSGGAGGRGTGLATKGRCAIECRVLKDGKPAVALVEARRTGSADSAAMWASATAWLTTMFAPPGSAGPAAASASSDGSGKATLSGLAPGAYRLTAKGPDGTLAKSYALLAADGTRAAAVLELLAANLTFEAKVAWSDGRAAEGIVALLPRDNPNPIGMPVPGAADDQPRGAIGPDGSVKIEGLSAGSYDVRAVLSDVVVSGPRATLPASGTYVLTIPAPGQQVSGRVLEAAGETPVAGATVIVHASLDERSGNYLARATAGPDGRFTVATPKSTQRAVNLSVEAPGYALAQRTVTGSDVEIVVRLVRAARVSGRVTTADGQPAAGAVVVASPESTNRGMPMGTRTTATADRDGRYALEGLVPGDVQVAVKGGGWVSPGLADAQPAGFNPFVRRIPAAGAITLDLTAVPAAKIEGRVLDVNGAPVAGASVVARPGGRNPFFGRFDASNPDTASTDAEGRFALDSLTPDSAYSLTADAPEQPQGKAGPFAVLSGAVAQVEIRFTAPRYVDVLVLYEREETPVAGARAHLLVNPSGQTAQATTDAEGRARVGPVGDGSLSVQIYGAMVAARSQPSPVDGADDGPGPYQVTVRVARGLAVEGRVLKADGSPAVGATVETDGRWRGPQGGGDVATASDGSFRLTGLGSGPQALRANWRGPGNVRLTGRTTATGGAKDVTITLGIDDARAMETFRFHVLDEAGAPVPAAQVQLAHEGGSSGTTVTDGWATLQTTVGPESSLGRSLAKGTAFVDVSDARGNDGLALGVGPARVGPLAVDQREVEVRLPAEKTIEGRVVAGDGARLAGVLVTARAVQKNQASQARTDAAGRFRIGALGEGDYLVSVAAAPEFVGVPTATVAAGTRDHVVTLKLGVTARIRVVDYGGKPVSGASVVAEPTPTTPAPGAFPGRGAPAPPPAPGMGGGEEWYPDGRGGWSSGRGGGVTTTEGGVAVLRGLDGDLTFTLRVQVPQGRDDVRPFRQEKWSPGDADVRLERGHIVAGSVRDAAGALVEGARVERKTGEGQWNAVSTNRDGTFRITGLDPGPVVLRATGPGLRRREAEGANEITVQAGNERVVLVVDAGLTLTVRVTNLADRKDMGRNFLSCMLLRWQDDRWSHGDHGWDRDGTGSVVFLGLKPDTRYAVWIPPNPGDDLYGWVADVRPGDVSVRLERGGTIRGRVTAPVGVTPGGGITASNDSGMSASGSVDAEGRFEIKGLPDGRWTLQVWHQADGKQYRATAEAQTGGTVDLALVMQAAPADSPMPVPLPVVPR